MYETSACVIDIISLNIRDYNEIMKKEKNSFDDYTFCPG